MRSLLKIEEADVLITGVFPSLPENQLALWKEANNMVFYDGRVEKILGFNLVATATDVKITGFAQSYVTESARVFYGTISKLFRYEDGVQTEIYSGPANGHTWSMEPFGAWLIATNGIDPMLIWKVDTGTTELAGANFDWAVIVKKLANHIVVFNTSIDDKEVRWSSRSNPELWEPDTNNSAGGTPVRDLDSAIIAAEYLGDGVGFYSKNSYGIVRYVGGSFVMSVTKMLDGIGAVGANCIVQVSNEHFGFGPIGIFRNNGVSFTYIDTPAVKRWVNAEYNPLYGFEVRGVHYQAKDLVLWTFVANDGVRKQIGYNYKTDSWMLGTMDITAADEPTVVGNGYPLVGFVSGEWGFYDAGGSLPASLKTNAIDAGDVDRWKLWDMVRLEHDHTGLVEVRFGFGETPKVVDYWSAWTPLALENWIQQESVYLTMEIRCAEAATFSLSGLEIFGEITAIQR